jgi:hypothetical protein
VQDTAHSSQSADIPGGDGQKEIAGDPPILRVGQVSFDVGFARGGDEIERDGQGDQDA